MKVYKSKEGKEKILQSYDKLLTQWDCDKTERDIATTYGSTHVIECGNRNLPPLVLFHGVGDDSALMWIYNAAFLSKHFHIFAIDTIGGPGKSIPNENYNKDFDDILWIDQVLDGLKIEKAFFCRSFKRRLSFAVLHSQAASKSYKRNQHCFCCSCWKKKRPYSSTV